MLKQLGSNLARYAQKQPLWTNVYGLARTLLALSLALTLLLNPMSIFFRPAAGIPDYPLCGKNLSLFCFVPQDYFYFEITRWLFIVLLLIIASGWRPRITGVIHAYITYSFYSTAMTMDGGEQVMMVLTLLLVPLTLTDSRKWHWQRQKTPNPSSNSYMIVFITGLCVYITIRIQVAIIYLNAAYAKTKGEHWVDGTAVYYFFQDTLLGISDGWSTIILPILESPLVIIPTWGTIVLEFLLFAALFSQKKHWKWFLTLGLLFHFSIAVFIGLYSFVMVMFAALILFLRPLEQEIQISRLLDRFPLATRFTHKFNKTVLKGGELPSSAQLQQDYQKQ